MKRKKLDEQKQRIRNLTFSYFLGDLSTFCCWVQNLIQTEPNRPQVIKLLFDEQATPTFGAVYFLLRAANLLEVLERGLLALDVHVQDVAASSPEFETKWNDTEIFYGGIDGLAEKLSERFGGDYEVCLDGLINNFLEESAFEWLSGLKIASVGFHGMVEGFKKYNQLDRFQTWLFNLITP